METGLRFGAIKRLLIKRIEMHNGERCVFVPKSNRIKYTNDRWIPLREELWATMKPLVEDRGPNEPIFTMPKRGHAAKMIKRDLDEARRKWIDEAPSAEERQKRERSDFSPLRGQRRPPRRLPHPAAHARGLAVRAP